MTATTPEPLLSIGEFSRYSGLSVRMLRHYDERGLLAPAEVDPFTGYRHYAASQLAIAARIRTLRDAGCGIALIAELLPLYASPLVLQQRLAAHITGLEDAAAKLDAQQELARSLSKSLERSTVAHGEVSERLFAATRVLRLRRTVACYPAEGELWADLGALIADGAGVVPADFGALIGATYFDDEFRDEDVEMAIWREYHGSPVARGDFEVVELPEQWVAWTTHLGNFDRVGEATAALGEWVAARGLRRVGPMFNVYVVGPGREPNPEKWVTEVYVPIG